MKDFTYYLDTELDVTQEYIKALLDCLANASSLTQDARKKIIESKEFNIILYNIENSSPPITLSSVNVILSLSRAYKAINKYLSDYGITNILFRLTNHPVADIQIVVTNSLCNFLLDSSGVNISHHINNLELRRSY